MSLSTYLPRGNRAPVCWPPNFAPAWSGCPKRPLLEILGFGWNSRPNNVSLIFDDGYSITNKDLKYQTALFAGYLQSRISPGDRVALAIGNRVEFVIAYLAVIANRGVVVSLSPELSAFEAEHVVEDSQCVLAIAEQRAEAIFSGIRDSNSSLREVVGIRGQEPHGLAHLCSSMSPVDLDSVDATVNDLVDIGYTSGTTGLPKALGGSHLEVLRYIDSSVRSHYPDEDGDYRVLYPLQFHYGDPLTALFTAIYRGFSVVIMRKFSVTRFWTVARDYKATEIMTIGSIPDMLLSQPESSIEREHVIRSASAIAIPRTRHAELERRFGFPWREMYGSSESGPAIAMPLKAGAAYVGTGAVGIPYPDIDARLVDEMGNVIEGAGSGELELSGNIVFEGYVNNSAATEEVLHDGWLRSGDLMHRDEDGVFYFEGRRKEIIRRSGVNIAPAEVEGVLRMHPDVRDAAVVAVADEMMGEEVKAYVELTDHADFRPGALDEFAATRLSSPKRPRFYEHRRTPFPRTPTQRIPKSQLKVDGDHRRDTAWDRLGSGGEA